MRYHLPLENELNFCDFVLLLFMHVPNVAYKLKRIHTSTTQLLPPPNPPTHAYTSTQERFHDLQSSVFVLATPIIGFAKPKIEERR